MSGWLELGGRVLPVFATLALGYAFKRGSALPPGSIPVLKSFVARLTLPAAIFAAFSSVRLDAVAGAAFLAVFGSCAVALLAGLGLDALGRRKTVRPFLMTAFEAGMLGLPLFSMLHGAAGAARFMMPDLGEIAFTFSVLIPLLDSRAGTRPTVKSMARRLAGNPVIWAVLLGLAASASGAGAWLASSTAGAYLYSALSFIGAPTGLIILFSVGYDLDFSPKALAAAIPTIGLRYAVTIPLLMASKALIRLLTGPLDPLLDAAMTVLFLMPGSFAIAVFGKEGEDSGAISTTLSLNTLVAVILLGLVAART